MIRRAVKYFIGLAAIAPVLVVPIASGGVITVPNASFESPSISYVGLNIDSWQKSPKPDWFIETQDDLWSFKVGAFLNTAPSEADHIGNLDGEQALWLFAVRDAGLSIDYHSVDWNDAEAPHEFDVAFETGKSYHLTIGVLGGGGAMLEGATMAISLYYHDAQTNVINVASTTVTHSSALFPSRTNVVDVQLVMPIVKLSDPWAGQRMGISFASTVSAELEGGYWDLDNVRLISVQDPTLANPTMRNDGFEITLLSEPGLEFDLLASDDLSLPIDQWAIIDTRTNDTGTATFTDETVGIQRFYELRQVP